MIALFLFSGRNIPSNTNTIHIYCCVVLAFRPEYSVQYKYNTHWLFNLTFRPEYSVQYKYNTHFLFTLTFRPEYSVQYKYNTHWLLLCLCCINFPAGIFRPIQIQYTLIVQSHFPAGIFRPIQIQYTCIVYSNFPAGIFRPIQIQYTLIVQSHFPAGIFRPIQIQYTCIVHSNFPARIFRSIQIQYTIIVIVIALFLFSGRNIPSNTNTIHIDCCCVCVVSTFRPEYSVQYKYNTQLLSLWLHCSYFPVGIFRPIQIQYTCIVYSNFPAGIFRPIQIQYTLIVQSHFPAGIFRPIQIQYTCIVHSNFPAGIFRPIQIQYTIIVIVIALFLFFGRNIPSNTNTIHIDCCCVCVVSTFRPEYSVQYKYNTQLLSLWLHCSYFPVGIFRPIQIQYTCIVHSNFPAGIFRSIQIQYTIIVILIALLLFSGRNIPSGNTNTMHIYCCFVCVASTFRPEYSVQYKYNTHLLLCCISFPAGIFRSIQIQYTIIVVLIALFLFSGRNIPSNTNTIHIDCCVCVAFTFRPEFSGRNILSNTNTMHIYC